MLESKKLRLCEGLSDVANLDADGNVWKKDSRMRLFKMMGNRLWHTDSSFKAPSGYASLLYARSIAPIGGNPEFTDLRAAYDALPACTKARLKGLVAEHSLLHSRKRIGFTTFTDAEMRPSRRCCVRPCEQFRSPAANLSTSHRILGGSVA